MAGHSTVFNRALSHVSEWSQVYPCASCRITNHAPYKSCPLLHVTPTSNMVKVREIDGICTTIFEWAWECCVVEVDRFYR